MFCVEKKRIRSEINIQRECMATTPRMKTFDDAFDRDETLILWAAPKLLAVARPIAKMPRHKNTANMYHADAI